MLNRDLKLPINKSFFLLGPRQTGKTTLVISALKDKTYWHLNLLHSDTYFYYQKHPAQFRLDALQKIIKENIKIIFIDEIQRVPELLNEIHALIETQDCQFILTGSSARKLKRGGANLLAGRALTRNLHPLTFKELGDLFNLDQILQFGSLPAVINTETQADKIDFLKSYIQTYLKEEIQSEALVRNLGAFGRFLELAGSNSGELINYSSIGRECGLSTQTVQSYFDILEDTLIAIRVDGWHKSLRKQLTKHPRYYFFDTGVTNILNGRTQIINDPALYGKVFEQFMMLETKRILDYNGSLLKMYHWRTNLGMETDLILARGQDMLYGIEIKSKRQIVRADLSGLIALKKENPKIKALVAAKIPAPFEIEGIEILPYAQYFAWLTSITDY